MSLLNPPEEAQAQDQELDWKNCDSQHKRRLFTLLRNRRGKYVEMLIASHNLEEANELRGKIKEIDGIKRALRKPAHHEQYSRRMDKESNF